MSIIMKLEKIIICMNKKFIKGINNQKGQVALLITLSTMFMLFFVGLFLTDELMKQVKTTLNKIHSSQSYYLADTGAEYIAYKLIREGSINISSFAEGDEILTENIFDGKYSVVLSSVNPSIRINSIGTYKQTNRNVGLEW